MVNSISSVRFCGDTNSVASLLERPGKYSNPAPKSEAASVAVPAEEKQSSGKGKKVLGVVGTLVAVAAVLAALPKVFPKAIAKLSADELASKPGFMKKVGHYVATVGNAIYDCTCQPILNLFKGKGKKVADNAANLVA